MTIMTIWKDSQIVQTHYRIKLWLHAKSQLLFTCVQNECNTKNFVVGVLWLRRLKLTEKLTQPIYLTWILKKGHSRKTALQDRYFPMTFESPRMTIIYILYSAKEKSSEVKPHSYPKNCDLGKVISLWISRIILQLLSITTCYKNMLPWQSFRVWLSQFRHLKKQELRWLIAICGGYIPWV